MSGEYERYLDTIDRLDKVSPSVCLAKWLQVTIHLHIGQTHSCHHPATHAIPIDEIQENPGALHNTKFKVQQQQAMLRGERPSECQYCWNVEDISETLPEDQRLYSDRIIKSNDWNWAGVHMIKPVTEKAQAGELVNPTYVEVSFSNVCNFKCGYCSPKFSSSWAHEVDFHGPYKLTSFGDFNDIEYLKSIDEFPIHHKEYNPYVEAFWRWWPDLVQDLKVFRITGGEPLLDKNTFKVMDMLAEETPKPDMELSINSNLGVPTAAIDKFIEKMKYLIDNGKIRRGVLYTSVDAHGKQAEYGRHGLDYDVWLANVDRILTEIPTLKMTVMCTGNILSITSFDRLMEDILELKLKHFSIVRDIPITIDTSVLRWPVHYNPAILPPVFADMLDSSLEFMEKHRECANGNDPFRGFFQFEIEKVRRLQETIRHSTDEVHGVDVNRARRDFKLFVDEHDRRRGTCFLETFPELKDFYRDCEFIDQSIIASQ